MYEARQYKDKVSRRIDGEIQRPVRVFQKKKTTNCRNTIQLLLEDDNSGYAIATPFPVSEWGDMKRHHIVSRSKIKNFVNNITNEGKENNIKEWADTAVKTHFSYSFIGKKKDEGKTVRLRLTPDVTKERVIANGFNSTNSDLYSALSSALQWTAGNIVPGPANRTDDPVNMNDLDRPLLKITGNSVDYEAFDRMVNLTSFDKQNQAIMRSGLEAAERIYANKTQRVPEKDKWELSDRKKNKWKVK